MAELPYVSASQIGQYLTCPRSWAYKAFLGDRSPETDKMRKGKDLHAALEGYLLAGNTGELPLQARNLATLPQFPRGEVQVEAPLSTLSLTVLEREPTAPVAMEYTIAGTPVKGFVDVVTSDGVWDHKFTSNLRYVPQTPEALAGNHQMQIYADWWLACNPDAATVWMRHGQATFDGKRRRCVEVEKSRAFIAEAMMSIERTVMDMQVTYRALTNKGDCDAVYDNGRTGCYRYGKCSYYWSQNCQPKGLTAVRKRRNGVLA